MQNLLHRGIPGALQRRFGEKAATDDMWVRCGKCRDVLYRKEWEGNSKVCSKCGHHERLAPQERIALLLDEGSFEELDRNLAAQAQKPGAPAALRAGRLARALYARSLGIVLALLFLLSFVLHWTQSARAAAEEALDHGEAAPTLIAYLGDPQFWFESFQNWQSEFLSTAVLVVLSIFLRQRESPESKPVAAPHAQTGE